MKTSVLIIAHNEEAHIAQCIESILNQSQPADEIVVVVHNSTDNTARVVEQTAAVHGAEDRVKVIPYQSDGYGPVYARMEGLRHVTGDIVLCMDGDAYAKKNWAATMSSLLQQNNVLVGSFIYFHGSLFDYVSNIWNKYFCNTKSKMAVHWVWGGSFGFWNHDKAFIQEVFEKSIALSKQLHLSRNPEDYWLALFMSQRGNLEVTNKTQVNVFTKDHGFSDGWQRNKENHKNGAKMRTYFYTR